MEGSSWGDDGFIPSCEIPDQKGPHRGKESFLTEVSAPLHPRATFQALRRWAPKNGMPLAIIQPNTRCRQIKCRSLHASGHARLRLQEWPIEGAGYFLPWLFGTRTVVV